MPKSIKEQCLNDASLNQFIRVKARKVHRVYSNLMDLEDIEHDIWVAVFDALDRRYDGKKPLIEFARSVAYSKYGHLLPNNGGRPQCRTLYRDSNAYSLEEVGHGIIGVSEDGAYASIETSFTLDQIELDLQKKYEESRFYYLAFMQMRYMRKGLTLQESASKVGISQTHSHRVFNTITREVGRKYRPEAILEEA